MQEMTITSIRLPKQVKRRGKIEAAKNDTTLSELIRQLLESYLDQQAAPKEARRATQ